MYAYVGTRETFAVLVANAYVLCGSQVRMEALGVDIIVQMAPQAWPLDANFGSSTCSRRAVVG